MTRRPTFFYLCYGRSPQMRRELRYSLETLLPEIGGEAQRVAIFTDRPEDFADLAPVRIVDISAELSDYFGGYGYRFRAKAVALARALELFGDSVLMDTDSFIRPGFEAAVLRALGAGAAMNQFVRNDPYPGFSFATRLPHLGDYKLDPRASKMLNSGLVAAGAERLPLIEDAIVLMDALWAAGLRRHDIEQFAIAEAFRLAGVKIALIEREFEHYCPRWSKRYMRRVLRRRADGKPVPYGKARVRLFKWRWTARLAWRRLTRN